MRFLHVLIQIIVTCFVTVSTKPSVNFPWLTTEQWTGYSNITMKTYSGTRVSNDSLLMIYFHDATIAVAELGPKKLLLGCELIEIYEEDEGKEFLKYLSRFNKPLEISFEEMVKLMRQCEFVDLMSSKKENNSDEIGRTESGNIFPRNPFSFISGIVPGTKWCGVGDIAATYHDLGVRQTMDRCCRQHDLCPVKLRRYQQKYNLKNDSFYTKSHCICDDMFFTCLKRTNTSASNLMGTVYFNLVALPCVQQISNNYEYRASKRNF